MLHAMCRYPLLRPAHPDKGALGNIVVNTFDIGVSVVNDVVLLFPDEIIAAQCVQRQSKCVIDPFTGGIAAMVGIMHYIKPYACEYEAKKQAGQDQGEQGHRHEQQCCVQANRREQEHNGFGV